MITYKARNAHKKWDADLEAWALLLLVLVVCGFMIFSNSGCSSSLPSREAVNLQNAAKTSAAAYRYESTDVPAAALIRATHCSVMAVLRDEKIEAPDSGILCR